MATFKISRTSTLSLTLFIMLLLLGFSMSQTKTEFQSRLAHGQQAMIDEGYQDMAYMLNYIKTDLEILDLENKTYTVFAPSVESFWGTYESDPPLSVIRYHVLPFKLDKLFLESSSSMSPHKIATLLEGHPLVVKTGQHSSLNQAFVDKWNIYNDGHLIVHGISDFFDSAYQTKYYPWLSETEAPRLSPTATPSSSSYCGKQFFYNLVSLMLFVRLGMAIGLDRPYLDPI